MQLDFFLEKYKTINDDFTHISLLNGKYNIPDNKIDLFYEILSETNEYYLVEKHLANTSNLIIDLDFKRHENKRQITDDDIYKIISIINNILDSIFINHDKTVYILQRDNLYKKNGIYKDGIHIIYPEIVGKYNILYLIRKILLDQLKWLETYSITLIDEIIDKSVIKSNGLVMYGGKKPGLNEYKITRIYDDEMNIIENKYSKKELLKILSIRNNNEILITLIPDEEIDDIINNDNVINSDDKIKETVKNIICKNELKYILMNILKKSRSERYDDWIKIGFCLFNISSDNLNLWIEFSKRSKKYKKGECEKFWKKMKRPLNALTFGTLYYFCKLDNIDMLKDLTIIKILDNIKYEFPKNNLDINKIIKGFNYIYIDINDNYCPIYKDIHEECCNYLEITKSGMVMKCRDCNCIGKIFPNDKEINITIKNMFNVTINNNYLNSIQDIKEEIIEDINIEIFNVTEDIKLNSLLSDTLNCTNGKAYDLAKILHHLFNNEFRYDLINKDWYYFNGRWRQCNNKLRTKISNDIVNYYTIMKNIIIKNNEQYTINNLEDNKIDKKELEYKYKIKKIDNLIGDLKTTAFKNNVIKEAEEIFIDNHDNIVDKLDTNVYLLGFDNGVYDIKNKCFREIIPDDYISMSVKYNYIDEQSEEYDKELENKLMIFLEEIQPNKTQRDYLLTYLSTCIIGLNLLQHFVIFLGDGRNGKGKITELLSCVFGDYFSSFNTKLITKPRSDAQSADPLMLDLRKRRIVIGSEIDKSDKINTGFVKLLTGRDKIKTRYNHGNHMIEFEVNYKIILLCNKVPPPDEDDKAYRKRLKCIEFPTIFLDNPINANEKKINYNLELEKLKQYFILLLIKYFNNYEENGLPNNEQIEELTNKINIENNTALEFMIQKTEISDDNHIHTQVLYEKFKDWFYENYPNDKIPSNRIFLQNIKLNYIVCDNIIVNKKKSTGIRNLQIKNYEI